MRRGRIELGAVGVLQAGEVARDLDGRHLHAQADAEVGQLVLARVLRGEDLALDAALAEAAGHEDGIEAVELVRVGRRERLGIDVLDLHARMVVNACMAQRLVERLVRVRQVGVLAAHRDRDLVLRVLDLVHQAIPALEIGGTREQLQLHADQLVQPLLVQHARHLVDGVGVPHRDDARLMHVGEEGNLLALVVRDAAVGAAQQRIGLDADLAHLLHRVLRRLGLQLAGGGDPRHVGEVHEGGVGRPHAQAHLAHGLEEGQRFDVAHRAADFDDRHLCLFGGADTGAAAHEVLDLVGDVRDHLHRLAEIVSAAFLLQHRLVDLAGGEVVGAPHLRVDEALVVAEVEVGLRAVIRHEHLAMLERAHRARVHVEVRVQLDEGDFEAARFEDRGKRCRRDALAEGGHHTAGDEDELGHVMQRSLVRQPSGTLWW